VLRTTANHHLITQGLAYPTYYRALFPDLRNEFTAVAKQARDGGLGVWASDATTSGADVTGLAALQNDIVIVPKLFRRLVDYLHLGDDSMARFPAFLVPSGCWRGRSAACSARKAQAGRWRCGTLSMSG
jgi:hypothetical protein